MENAVDALRIAGSVLLYMLALSIAMLTFSQARETIDVVLSHSDREAFRDEAEGEDRNLFYYTGNAAETERYVGLETIVPTMYRAYKESFKVEFIFNDHDNTYLYENYNRITHTAEKICYLDDSQKSAGRGITDSEDFINGILYHKFDPELNNFSTLAIGTSQYRVPYGSDTHSLYDQMADKLKDGTVTESVGTYYLEDIMREQNGDKSASGKPEEGKLTDNSQKKTRRIITYTFNNS